ncbi:MAG: GFA family protein [Betaproteobacteria bacterium]|nr:GFA family protein [Betaproteobacteria bacterium]
MHVEGGCHCGCITYEAEVDPDTVGICHCTDCQHLTGTAYRVSVRSLKGTFKLLSGQPKIYIKTAESGNQRAHGFCPECGTPLFATTVGNPDVYGIRVGTTRQRTQLRPKRQGWCRSALDWVTNLESLPQNPKQIV